MKKLSAILSLLMIVGLFHQGVVLAEMTKEKKSVKTNFGPKNKHVEAMVSKSNEVAAQAPVVSSPEPVASPSTEESPKV